MSDRFWVGSSGNWSDTAHWSITSNGAGGAEVPTSSDNVFIDSNSGLSVGTITLATDEGNCNDFTSMTGVNYTIDGNTNFYNFNIFGSATFESGLTLNIATISFNATSVGKTITWNDAISENQGIAFNSVGGGWTLQDDLTCTGQFYQENGTFDANDHNVTANDFYFYANTGYTPTVIMGSGTWTPERNTWVLDENNGVKVIIVDPPIPPVYGCTNPAAENYNPLATVDDGSCIVAPQPGPPINRYFGKDY